MGFCYGSLSKPTDSEQTNNLPYVDTEIKLKLLAPNFRPCAGFQSIFHEPCDSLFVYQRPFIELGQIPFCVSN